MSSLTTIREKNIGARITSGNDAKIVRNGQKASENRQKTEEYMGMDRMKF